MLIKYVYNNKENPELERFFEQQHVFPVSKYRLVYEKAIKEKTLTREGLIKPKELTIEELSIIHSREYLEKLQRITETQKLAWWDSDNPINKDILEWQNLSADGTYKAALIALEHRIGIHIGGGLHHAQKNHPSGFCVYNDVAYAIKKLLLEGKIKKAMTIDCDVHQGDGTANLLRNENVYTFSIHQQDNFPIKTRSSYDIGLYSHERVDNKLYLKTLRILPHLIEQNKPELIIYIAGADPYKEDELGGFQLTKQGLRERDRYIIGIATKKRIPIIITFGGGYAENTQDTADIHYNTIKEATKAYK